MAKPITDVELEEFGNKLVLLYIEVLSSCPRPWFDIGFFEVEKIEYDSGGCDKCRNVVHINECNDNEIFIGKNYKTSSYEELKEDIFKEGIYWPIFLNFENKITDGTHKLTVLKELIAEGRLPKNKKILCIKNKTSNYGFLESTTKYLFRTLPLVEDHNYYSLNSIGRNKILEKLFVERQNSYFRIVSCPEEYHQLLYDIAKTFNIFLRNKHLNIPKPREINVEGFSFFDIKEEVLIKTSNQQRASLLK